MKQTKQCPKCNGTELYSNQGISKSGDRSFVQVTGSVKLFVDVYVCLECGYFEEYIEKEDLESQKKIDKTKSVWRKI